MLLDRISNITFRYEDVLALKPDMNYQELHDLLEQWETEGRVRPVKRQGKTSFRPSVYQMYRKIRKKQDVSAYVPEIRRLHTRLNVEGYLKNVPLYIEERDAVIRLSEYLWKSDWSTDMSVKEKSFDIWGDEKFLESPGGRQMLKFHGITMEDLGVYETPEPFFSKELQKEGAVLVLENKDPWYSLGRLFSEEEICHLLGEEIGLLVYGEGKKVQRSGALTDYLREIGWEQAEILYGGDIDREGICIFDGMQKENPELKIRLFVRLYEEMLGKAEKIPELPDAPSRKDMEWNREVLRVFSDRNREWLGQILDRKKMIPQEIINYQDYRRMYRGETC